jgi:hypothetical protein
MEQSSYWQANSRSTNQEKYPPYIDSEPSLPCSQPPAIGPYPEPDESDPHPHTPFL